MDAREPASDAVSIELAEEIARVGKRVVETGRVRVEIRTDTVEEPVAESLRRTRVEVERVAVNRTLEAGEPVPKARQEADGTTVLPVLEEVLVVERRLVLREEVRIRPVAEDETVRETVTLRRQRADVFRDPA